MALYDIFSGTDLQIAEKIQRRRLQMLVHSYIYYDLNNNLISDATWSSWAVELAQLQKDYPEIEKRVPYREGFEEWDGSTGAFLPYKMLQIQHIASLLMGDVTTKDTQIKLPEKPKIVQKNTARKKLF